MNIRKNEPSNPQNSGSGRSNMAKVTFSSSERAVLARAAKENGLPLSTFLRHAALKHAGGEPK